MIFEAGPAVPGGAARPSRSVLIALSIILAAGFLLKLLPIVALAMSPPFSLGDPDGYAYSGAYVADHPGRWMWLRDVVQFGQYLKAPLYPAMMCAFALVWRGGFPLTAAIFQVLLGAAAGLAIFRMGQLLHSDRAGLIATALFMFYLPNYASPMFGQEALFIPLSLAAMALHLQCVIAGGRLRSFALVGGLYGLTALTRSLPLYYLPPIAALQVYWAADRRQGARAAAVLLGAFLLTLLPYSFFISAKWHQWVFVDTQGVRAIVETYSDHPDSHKPGMVESLTMVGKAFVASPAREVRERISRARAFFYLKGGQWLQVDAPRLATSLKASMLKGLVHVFYDVPLGVVFLAAPLGFAFARDRRVAVMLVLWPLIALALMIAFLWSGGRYTASFLPQLTLGAAVVLAGKWRRPGRGAVAAALLCTAVVAIPVVKSVPLSAWGRADYGVEFRYGASETQHLGTMKGEAGFGVFPEQGRIEMTLTPANSAASVGSGGWCEIRVDGARQRFIRLVPGRTEPISISSQAKLAFVEVRELSDAGTAMQAPPSVDIEVSVGRVGRVR